MNENLIIMGRAHQAVITKLIHGLANLCLNAKSTLFPYPETMIDESRTSPAPDVMLVDRQTDLTKAIIEITHTQGVKKDAQKLLELMRDYDVPEGFIYDYKLGVWYRFDLNNPQGEPEKSSYCAALDLDLDGFL